MIPNPTEESFEPEIQMPIKDLMNLSKLDTLIYGLTKSKETDIKASTIVKVKSIGKLEIVDDIESNWIQIEIMNDTKDSEGKLIPKGLTGWCFGGYVR